MSLIKNSTIVVAGIIISNIFAYVFHIYVGRVLGPADYGVFGALMSLFLLVSLPAGSIGSAVTKFTARFKSKKEYQKIGALRKRMSKKVFLISAFIFLFIVLLSGEIADYLKIDSNVPVMLVGFTLIFAFILPINRGVLQGMKKFKIYSINTILESVSRLILVVFLVMLGLGADGAILAYGLAYLVAFAAIFPFIKDVNGKEKSFELKPVWKFVIIVLFTNLILQLVINLPTIFIKHYLSAEFTGLWTAALTLARVSLFVTGGIALVMFPEVAEKENKKERRKVLLHCLLLTVAASVGIASIFLLFGNLAVSLLYGVEYLGAVPLLQWMAFAMIFLVVIQLFVNYWLAKMGS